MTDQEKRQERTRQQENPKSTAKPTPKMKVFESGKPEQEEPIEAGMQNPSHHQATEKAIARQKEREEYRHGGIPLGSDPRE